MYGRNTSPTRTTMSLLSAVEEVIKTYKVENVKLHRSIQFYKEILQNMITQPGAGSEETDLADNAAADAGSSSGETEDIELLERALEKALQVRTVSEVSKQGCNQSKPSITPKETENMPAASALTKEAQPTIKSSKKSANLHRIGHKKQSVSHSSRPSAGHKPVRSKNVTQHHCISAAQTGHHQQTVLAGFEYSDQITASLSKNKMVRSITPRDDLLSQSASAPLPSSNDIVSFLVTDGSRTSILHHQNGHVSEQTAKWKYLRRKQDRLWEKVITLQSKTEAGRSHFMQRMRAMFPNDWPCGSPDETRCLLHRPIDPGLKLAHVCRTNTILVKQPSEMDSKHLGDRQAKSQSCPTVEHLQLTAAELHISADKVKEEWNAWDQWRPEGGCLCPSETAGVFGCGTASPLPLTITYRTEQELQQLERLRMRVALLQQEIYLEQVLLDALSPLFSSIRPGPGCPSPNVLRDIYSLLGQGGERFAAIIQDSEHE